MVKIIINFPSERKYIFSELVSASHRHISKSKPWNVQLSLLMKQALEFSLCSLCKKSSLWPASLIILEGWTYARIVTSGSVFNKWVRRERGSEKNNPASLPPILFPVWSHLPFFLAHTKSSDVEPGRWWGYSVGKMCSNVISFKGAHGAARKDGLWYFCLLNLMVGLWHLYLLNVQNLIHHCWQLGHVLGGWHNCLFLQRDLTVIRIWETKKRWSKNEDPAFSAATQGQREQR